MYSCFVIEFRAWMQPNNFIVKDEKKTSSNRTENEEKKYLKLMSLVASCNHVQYTFSTPYNFLDTQYDYYN